MKYSIDCLSESDFQDNLITKDMDRMLRKIDNRIAWLEYIPAKMLSVPKKIIAVGFKDGKTKYIQVKSTEPFAIARTICNTLDDFCVQEQFLLPRQLAPIWGDIQAIATERTAVTNEIIEMFYSPELSDKDCAEIYQLAQKRSIIPENFPFQYVNKEETRKILIEFLKGDTATFVDTLWIKKEASMILQRKEQEHDNYELDSCI